MIVHSNDYKEKIKELGRQIDAKINYYKSRGLNTEDDKNILTEDDLNFTIEQTNFDEITEIIGGEDIYGLDVIHKGDMLKSYMGEVDFEVKQNLSVGDGIEAEFGLKVDETDKDYSFNGSCKQEQENLFNGFSFTKTNYGITFTYYEDGSIYVDGTSTGNAFSMVTGESASYQFELQPGTYLIDGGLNNVQIQVINSSGTNIGETTSSVLTKPFTITSAMSVYVRLYISSGKTVNNLILKPVLTKLLSPENPVEIKTLTGNTAVGVPTKNLLQVSDKYSTNNGITASINDGVIILNGTASANSFINGQRTQFSLLLQPGTYTISTNNNVGVNGASVRLMKSDGSTIVDNTTCSMANANGTKTFTITETIQGFFQIRTSSGITYNDFTFKPQIERGSTTTYEKYTLKYYNLNLGDIELGSVAGYNDVIYNVSENWYLYKTVGKTTLNGSENWVADGSLTNTARYKINNFGYYQNMLCDHFWYYANYNSDYEHFYSTNGNALMMFISKTTASNVNAFKTWLSNNNVTIYFPLATPTTTQITDENLLKQLNKIKEGYEFINYGKYIIYNKKYNEDTDTYTYKSYDRMLFAMKPFDLEIEYPITVKELISMIGDKIGCPIDDVEPINGSQEILSNPYYELNVTYRDVLDDLSAIVGGPICINNGHISVAYISNTGDTVNEKYLKDAGVSFGEKYGPINKLTFTKLDGEDFITRQDAESISANGICEIKLKENPFLQFENWDDYIDDLFEYLNGIEYYINDVSSTGITYYDFMDKYSVQRGEIAYQCLMLNDEIKIHQGLEESIYTEKPKQDVPTYETSTTDSKDVSFTVDRQGRQIISKVGKDEVISTINQTPEEIKINANKISLEGYTTINDGFSVDLQGNMTCANATINGVINNGSTYISNTGYMKIKSTKSSPKIIVSNQDDYSNYGCYIADSGIYYEDKLSNSGYTSTMEFEINGAVGSSLNVNAPLLDLRTINKSNNYNKFGMQATSYSIAVAEYNNSGSVTSRTVILPSGITTPRVTQTSLEKDKKNIKKYENALEEVLKTDIYEYNLKNEKDEDKKHIGFVIGDKYNYSKKIVSVNEKNEETGVDTYSMISLCLQAIKEQQEQIEELKKEISKLKGGI